MAKTGKVVINKVTGEFSVDLSGYQGKGCSVDAAAFTKGAQVTKDVHKPEWNQTQATQKSASQCS